MSVCPWHQRVDVAGEMTIGQLCEQIAQIGIGLDALHLAGCDQAGEAGPVSAAFVVTGEERIAAVHGRAADGVFHEVGVDVASVPIERGLAPF